MPQQVLVPAGTAADQHPHVAIFIGQLPPGVAAPPPASPPPTGIATALRPDSNDGMWINYDGRRWLSAGAAIRFDDSKFVRIGDHDGFPVFRRKDGGDDVIYLPTRRNLVAPYRLKAK
jgi:hypothetical protein